VATTGGRGQEEKEEKKKTKKISDPIIRDTEGHGW
jgi:hypothetical protein